MRFTNTRIYCRALELVRKSQAVVERLPKGYGFLGDQMRRAASSVLLNFAEGCGKSSAAERRRYFETARASAYEVAATFDVAHAFGALDDPEHAKAQDICDHLAAMLTRFEHAKRRR
jgi:four helix bundle protein